MKRECFPIWEGQETPATSCTVGPWPAQHLLHLRSQIHCKEKGKTQAVHSSLSIPLWNTTAWGYSLLREQEEYEVGP